MLEILVFRKILRTYLMEERILDAIVFQQRGSILQALGSSGF